MSNAIDKPDILAKYRRPGQKPARATEGSTPSTRVPQPYKPYELSKDAKRHLEVRVKFPDPAQCPLNSMITNVISEWRRGLRIGLYFSNSMIIDIEGKNLQELVQAIKEWKVDWIEEFDPRFHVAPIDPSLPFIKSISIHKNRPEIVPPVNERH